PRKGRARGGSNPPSPHAQPANKGARATHPVASPSSPSPTLASASLRGVHRSSRRRRQVREALAPPRRRSVPRRAGRGRGGGSRGPPHFETGAMEVDGAAEAGAAAAAAAGAKPLTPEEEAVRRSTDCVYFLASPLTCKKGNECDFRHSEGARMNPRDCWYWLNGSCLNPKCSFRHPPIDGLFGAPTPGVPPVSSHYGAYNSGKQMVPCYYFQKGNCLKGDRCPFYHGPQAAGNNPTEQLAKVSSLPSELPQAKKNEESAAPNNSTLQGSRIIDDKTMVHAAKSGVGAIPTELASSAVKSRPNSEQAPNDTLAAKKSFRTEEDHPMSYENQLPFEDDSVQEWNQSFQMPPTDDLPQNSREADDFLGESSPGFDVLVDNDADGAAYLHDEEDFGRDMFPVEDYEYGPADFDI
ncbi:unnamed protein product, partial [Urochloa humidicola]